MLVLAGCIPAAEPRFAPPPPPADVPISPPPKPQPQPVAETPQPIARPRPARRAPVEQLAAPRPAWEAAPVTADARLVRTQDVVVRSGDTLSAIAERTGASIAAIARRNTLSPPYALRAGQRLVIPGGRYHRVDPGQTGIGIARAYGVPWSQVVAANDLREPFVLVTGQRVLIPSQPASAAARAAAFTLDVDTILTGGEPAVASGRAPVRPVKGRTEVPAPTIPVAPPSAAPGRFVWPLTGQIVRRFGIGRSGERFDGIEIAVPSGTEVKAAAAGTVAYAGDGIAALGGLVIVKHGDSWTSIYGHAGKLLVRRGQAVTRGQVIALSGATGFADQPELHFELRRGRSPVNPVTQLPRR
ncbi:peptidoglycan DD-metalloendopeptidase family protein [Sphingomonas sp. NPDC079357]|uniref:peptidoglycan DD-metalloendopeptidase family protein n=1 Tax=Sphingomonas sp. NPDC079357 TaxID=3364518 RepID=UPI00384DDBB0